MVEGAQARSIPSEKQKWGETLEDQHRCVKADRPASRCGH